MLSVVAILAAASLVAADGTTGTPTAGQPDSDNRTALPECQVSDTGLCALGSCRGKAPAEQATCRQACDAKQAACKAAVEAAVQKRITDNADAFKARLADLKKTTDLGMITTVEDARARCTTMCDNNIKNEEKLTACKAVCTSIVDIKSGLRAAADLLQAAAKARYEQLVKTNPEGAADLKDAADKLRDAVATQRAFLSDARQKLAEALDARTAAIQKARLERQEAVKKAKDKIDQFKADLEAAPDAAAKAKVRADFKADVQTAVAAAKAAFKEARDKIKADRKAIVQSVLDANKERKKNRRVIIADFKKLIGEFKDLKGNVTELDANAQVTLTPGTKRAEATASVIMTCDNADAMCYTGINNVISGFVAAEGDVDIIETNDAELNEAEVADPTVESSGSTTAAVVADTTKSGKDKNSGSALLLSVAAVVCAVATLF